MDAALAAALDDLTTGSAPRIPVFVHVDPAATVPERTALDRLGVRSSSLVGGIATASLSPSQVRALSQQPWVRSIRLSGPLNLLDDR